MRRLAFPFVFALLAPIASAQTRLGEWNGTGGERLGQRLAAAGDLDQDGIPDFAIGSIDKVRVVSGRTLQVLRTFTAPQPGTGFGKVFDFGDCDGDGWRDLIASAPLATTFGTESGSVWVFSGRTGQALLVLHGTTALERLGESLALLGDVTLDGRADFAVGSPNWNGARGRVRVVSGRDGTSVLTLQGSTTYERLGIHLASVGNVDGDARPELGVAQAGNFVSPDRIQVWSLERNELVYTLTEPPFRRFEELGDLNADGLDDIIVFLVAGSGQFPFRIEYGGGLIPGIVAPPLASSPPEELGFGGLADYDGDGQATEYLVGINDYAYVTPGYVGIYRDNLPTAQIFDSTNSSYDSFGRTLQRVGDVDGNGSIDFAVGAPTDGLTPQGGSPNGRVVLLSAVTPPPVEYCTAKVNGLGCVPQLSHVGTASLTGASYLTIRAHQLLNRRSGLCLWGNTRQEAPFQGGYLCVAPPLHRGSVGSTGGNSTGNDCSGSLEFTFSLQLLWLNAVDVGDLLRAQFWYRDPVHPDGSGVGLSSAYEIRAGL